MTRPLGLEGTVTRPEGWRELVLHTDGGLIPYVASDNPKGDAGLWPLAMRFHRAGLITAWTVHYHVADDDLTFNDPRYIIPQLVLSEGLAIAEGRAPRPYTDWLLSEEEL